MAANLVGSVITLYSSVSSFVFFLFYNHVLCIFPLFFKKKKTLFSLRIICSLNRHLTFLSKLLEISGRSTMADDSNEELIKLCSLLVRLSNELDYKNHRLMEKEGISLEKFATMSSLIEEKDRLLGERCDVIGSLMAQNHRLDEVFAEEKRKCEQLKQEVKNLKNELEVQQQKLDTKTKEQEEPMALIDKELGTVTINSTNANECLDSPENLVVNNHDKLLNKMKKLQHLGAVNEVLKAQLDNLRKELNEKGEALRQLESLNQTLVSDKCSSNEELKDARKEAIKCFLTMDSKGTKVGIKRIGDIDPQPFRDVCSKKLCSRNWEEESDKLCSLWQENVKDPSWNPFKKEIKSGRLSEIVDENDKKLVKLREECGEEPSNAVANALLDLKKYNPGPRSSIPELWNFEEGRRAFLKEVIQYMNKQLEVNRSKYTEQSRVITELMEEKQKLLQKLSSVNILMEEKDKVLKEKFATVRKLMVQDKEKETLLGQISATINTLMAEKHINPGKRTIHCMKEQIEKLKHALQPQETAAKQMQKPKETKQHSCGGDKIMKIKEDNTEWYFDYLIEKVEPTVEELTSSQFRNTKEKISSTSENRKFQGLSSGEKLKLPKAEPGFLGELPDGMWNPRAQSNPSKASASYPSQYSILLERFFQTTTVKKEDKE